MQRPWGREDDSQVPTTGAGMERRGRPGRRDHSKDESCRGTCSSFCTPCFCPATDMGLPRFTKYQVCPPGVHPPPAQKTAWAPADTTRGRPPSCPISTLAHHLPPPPRIFPFTFGLWLSPSLTLHTQLGQAWCVRETGFQVPEGRDWGPHLWDWGSRGPLMGGGGFRGPDAGVPGKGDEEFSPKLGLTQEAWGSGRRKLSHIKGPREERGGAWAGETQAGGPRLALLSLQDPATGMRGPRPR